MIELNRFLLRTAFNCLLPRTADSDLGQVGSLCCCCPGQATRRFQLLSVLGPSCILVRRPNTSETDVLRAIGKTSPMHKRQLQCNESRASQPTRAHPSASSDPWEQLRDESPHLFRQLAFIRPSKEHVPNDELVQVRMRGRRSTHCNEYIVHNVHPWQNQST